MKSPIAIPVESDFAECYTNLGKEIGKYLAMFL